MSTENNTNEQNAGHRGPDTTFVIGLVVCIICIVAISVFYLAKASVYSDLTKRVGDLEKQLPAELKEDPENYGKRLNTLEKDINELKEDNIVNQLKEVTVSVKELIEVLRPPKEESPQEDATPDKPDTTPAQTDQTPPNPTTPTP